MLAWWLLGSVASAGSLPEALSTARRALLDRAPKAALVALEDAEALAVAANQTVPGAQAAAIFYYRGVALRQKGDRKDVAPDLWRAALAIDNGLAWDESLLEDGDDFSYFEALRGEVSSRAQVDPLVPEQLGRAKVYIDGERIRSGETVIGGRHLAQITCDDGTVAGTWTDFVRPVKWVKLCVNGIDTTVVVADDEEDDLFGGLVPSFDEPDDTPDAPAPPEPAPDPGPVVDAGRDPLAVGLTATGGGLLATGIVLNFAMAAPAWQALEAARSDAGSITEADAEGLEQKFQRARLATLATGGIGLGLLGGGTYLMLTDVQLAPLPRGLVVRGRF